MSFDAAIQRRRAIIARAQGLSATQLARIVALTPDLSLLEGSARPLAALEIPPRTREWLATPDPALVDEDLHWLDRTGIVLLLSCDADYPPLLLQSPDPPVALFVRGQVRTLADPQLAMVGSRNPTAGGRATAREFARTFARAGLTITSGLALGIDAACHEGALDADGTTIGVLGHGLDRMYPPQNAHLAERVAAAGAVISEFPRGFEPRPAHFPQRNRIIAALSLGTLVVEAAQDSGSLITARLAGIAGREVFAVPSSIHNTFARGCHELIRQGAKLVERPEDVWVELKLSLSSQLLVASAKPSSIPPTLDKEYKILLDALAFEPASVDSLIERTGMASESIASMLLILELEGHVAPHPGGRYSRMAGPASSSSA
jgi:DNA processing protein